MGGVVVTMVIRAFLFAPLFARSLGGGHPPPSQQLWWRCSCAFVCVRVFVCSCVRSCVRVCSFVCVRSPPSLPPYIYIYIYIYIYLFIYLYFNRAAHPRPYIYICISIYIFIYLYFNRAAHPCVCVCVTSAGRRYEKHPPRHSIAAQLNACPGGGRGYADVSVCAIFGHARPGAVMTRTPAANRRAVARR